MLRSLPVFLVAAMASAGCFGMCGLQPDEASWHDAAMHEAMAGLGGATLVPAGAEQDVSLFAATWRGAPVQVLHVEHLGAAGVVSLDAGVEARIEGRFGSDVGLEARRASFLGTLLRFTDLEPGEAHEVADAAAEASLANRSHGQVQQSWYGASTPSWDPSPSALSDVAAGDPSAGEALAWRPGVVRLAADQAWLDVAVPLRRWMGPDGHTLAADAAGRVLYQGDFGVGEDQGKYRARLRARLHELGLPIPERVELNGSIC